MQQENPPWLERIIEQPCKCGPLPQNLQEYYRALLLEPKLMIVENPLENYSNEGMLAPKECMDNQEQSDRQKQN